MIYKSFSDKFQDHSSARSLPLGPSFFFFFSELILPYGSGKHENKAFFFFLMPSTFKGLHCSQMTSHSVNGNSYVFLHVPIILQLSPTLFHSEQVKILL